MNLPEIHPTDSVLNEYLDRALPPGETTVLENHLEQCAHCAYRLDALRQVFASLQDLPDPLLEVDLSTAVTARLGQQTQKQLLPGKPAQRRMLFPRLPQLVTGLQALAALLLLALYWQTLSHGFSIAIPSLGNAWQAALQPGLTLVSLLSAQFTQVTIRLPQWNSTAFPLLETLILLAIIWLAGNSILIFETRHPRRKS
jgi:anti-sigma factor RsiW